MTEALGISYLLWCAFVADTPGLIAEGWPMTLPIAYGQPP